MATITFKESVNKYYKLKSKYDTDIKNQAKKIIKLKISGREKKAEFKKRKPQCIQCKRPVGTLFSSKFDKENHYRILSATCGDIVNPCDLHIKINAGGEVETYLDIIYSNEELLNEYKNDLIRDKNNLLFGYITAQTALQHFDVLKNDITDITNSYAFHLEEFNDITDNKKKKETLNVNQTQAYTLIDSIKETMVQYDSTENTQLINDTVDVYINQLVPLLKTVRDAKYSSTRIEIDDKQIQYLIQEPYTLIDIETALVLPNVIKFHLGMESGKKQKTAKSRKPTIAKKTTRKARTVVKEKKGAEEDKEKKEEEEEEEEEEDDDEDYDE